MRTLALLAAASAVALTGAMAYAQPAPNGGPGGPGGPRGRAPLTSSDLGALTDARIAGIQAGLKLTEEQQKLWPPVEQALRASADARAKRMEEFRARREARRAGQGERPDMMQMLERRSDWASQNATDLKTLTDALKPFWASLNDQQKKLLPILMRPEGGRHGMRHHGRGPGPRGDRHAPPPPPPAPAPQQ